MKISSILWGSLLLWWFSAAGAQESSSAEEKEKERLQGTWYNLSAESDGRQQTGVDEYNLHIITGDKVVTEVDGKIIQESIFTVEPGEKHGTITFQMRSGPDGGRTWVGIYRLDGDTLKWCGAWEEENNQLPLDFTTKPGDGYFLRVMRLLKH